MRKVILGSILIALLTSCAAIPRETVTLSKTIGTDLQVLQNSHTAMVQLYYGKIEADINRFVEEVYAPYAIHHVLQPELVKYQKGEPSLYGIIETAGKAGGKEATEEALNVMVEFQEAANSDISAKRNELLQPILFQEKELLNSINLSYRNVLYANSTLTAYLTSLRKVKESQKEALSIAGLDGIDEVTINKLVELSNFMDAALKKSKTIDAKSDEVYKQAEEVMCKIKEITNKK